MARPKTHEKHKTSNGNFKKNNKRKKNMKETVTEKS